MRLFNQATAECSNLYTVLNTISPPSTRRQIVPYELDVLHARTMYWAGDFRGYLDELVRLIGVCKSLARRDDKGIWAERGMRTGMMVVTQLIEMQVRACMPRFEVINLGLGLSWGIGDSSSTCGVPNFSPRNKLCLGTHYDGGRRH